MTNEVDLILERAGKLSADETMTLVQKLMTDLRRKILPIKRAKYRATNRFSLWQI